MIIKNILILALLLTSPLAISASLSLDITVHVDDKGNLNFSEEMWAGTRGEGRKIQEFSVSIADANGDDVRIIYQCHYESSAWSKWTKEGKVCGDESTNKQLEAVKFKLSGKDASKYRLLAKCHVENKGDDQGFVGASNVCGTVGLHKRLEAFWLEVRSKD